MELQESIMMNNEFINLYSAENPILYEGDDCYALIFNTDCFHRPIMVRGVVIYDRFVNGMNKQYFIKILEILESPKAIEKFCENKTFMIYKYDKKVVDYKKLAKIDKKFNFNENLFKVEAFFVRNSEEKIKKLRKEYIQMIKGDLDEMLEDLKQLENEV